MRLRILTLFAAVAVAGMVSGTGATTARANVALNVGVRVGDPPPPPAYVFDSEPEVILVPSTRVYYVPQSEFDLYRYGRYWYINRDGWWYRSAGYRGPFGYIGSDRVPASVINVPPKYRRYPLGPAAGRTMGQAFQQWRGQGAQGAQAAPAPQKKHWDRDRTQERDRGEEPQRRDH
jgi:hypothetical protein